MIRINPAPPLARNRTSRAHLAIAVAGLLTLSACASSPPQPTAELQAAEQAIASADQARAADNAAPQMREARENLAAAHVAVQQNDMAQARYRAEEARVYAELASARNAELKAKAVNDELRRGNTNLELEIERNTGGTR